MRRCLLLLVVFAVGFAPAPFPRPERRTRPVNETVGLWEGGSRIEITIDRLNYHPGTTSACQYHLKINAAVRPATYEITGVAGTSTAGRSYLGIYRVEGETLTLRYVAGGSQRPTSFDGPVGNSEVYKRVKH